MRIIIILLIAAGAAFAACEKVVPNPVTGKLDCVGAGSTVVGPYQGATGETTWFGMKAGAAPTDQPYCDIANTVLCTHTEYINAAGQRCLDI